MKKYTWHLVIGGIIVLIAGSVWYAGEAAKKANVGIEITSHIKGNPDAAVTLIKYSDFQCPACAAAAPVAADIVEMYGEDMSFEYRHFPLISIHPHAVAAGVATEAAGQQGKFYEMHDALFENQSTWSPSANPQVYFMQYAEELGLDMSQFRRQLSSSLLEDKVRDGFREAREKGYTGTPTFELNGERVNLTTYDDLRDQVAAAIGGPTSDTPPEVEVEFGL